MVSMAIYSSMAFQSPTHLSSFKPKLRPLTLCTRLNAASPTVSFFNSNNHCSAATRYLNCNVTTTFPNITIRCFHTIDTTDSEPWDYDDDDAAYRRGYYAESNMLLKKGPRGTFATNKGEDGMYVRVDVPGVGDDGMKVWLENDDSVLCFECKGLKDKYAGRRRYGGKFICCTDIYELKGWKGSVNDGILLLTIPKKKSPSLASANPLTKMAKLLFGSLTKVSTTPTPTPNTNIAEDDDDDNDDDEYEDLEACRGPEKHPFQISGPTGARAIKDLEEGRFIRIDMPGVGKDDLTLWGENDTLYFKGKAPRLSEYEDSRIYSGGIKLNGPPGFYIMGGTRAEVKNGVVKIMVPGMMFPAGVMF